MYKLLVLQVLELTVSDHNSLLIYGSLRTPTLDRFSQVTHYSTFISMIACLTVALAGFLTFGDKTLGNLLVCNALLCPMSAHD